MLLSPLLRHPFAGVGRELPALRGDGHQKSHRPGAASSVSAGHPELGAWRCRSIAGMFLSSSSKLYGTSSTATVVRSTNTAAAAAAAVAVSISC